LPALFGKHIKKNIIYDLLNENEIHNINYNSLYQWYNLSGIVTQTLNADPYFADIRSTYTNSTTSDGKQFEVNYMFAYDL
jgi:hypothetical protein